MLGAYGEWAASKLPGFPAQLSYCNDKWSDPDEWRGTAKELFADLTRVETTRPAPPMRLIAEGDYDGLRFECLEWQLPYGPPTSAVYLKPADSDDSLPGVLALHDHGGVKHVGWRKIAQIEAAHDPFISDFRDTYYGGVAWANELAKRGFGVLVPDPFLFGSRRINPSELPNFVANRMMNGVEKAGPGSGDSMGESNYTLDLPADRPAMKYRATTRSPARMRASSPNRCSPPDYRGPGSFFRTICTLSTTSTPAKISTAQGSVAAASRAGV